MSETHEKRKYVTLEDVLECPTVLKMNNIR
jgi:hypothetical protein